MKQKLVLIHFQVISVSDKSLLRKALNFMKSVQWTKASSIYRVSLDEEGSNSIHDLRTHIQSQALVCVVAGSTLVPLVSLVAEMRQAEVEAGAIEGRAVINIRLLLYGTETLMNPKVTIPEPELHLRPEMLWPAAEVAPDWMHPVLGQDLQSLVNGSRFRAWGSFVEQGKSVLDFSGSDR